MDLGSGNGLIPLTAARMNRAAAGAGRRHRPQARGRIQPAGAAARVWRIGSGSNIATRSTQTCSEATVMTMWLFPELMRLLRPVILERARPGTRVLTSTWDLGSWQPDQVDSDGDRRSTCGSCRRASPGGWHWDLKVGGRRIRYASLSRTALSDGGRGRPRRRPARGARSGDAAWRRHLLHARTSRSMAWASRSTSSAARSTAIRSSGR